MVRYLELIKISFCDTAFFGNTIPVCAIIGVSESYTELFSLHQILWDLHETWCQRVVKMPPYTFSDAVWLYHSDKYFYVSVTQLQYGASYIAAYDYHILRRKLP